METVIVLFRWLSLGMVAAGALLMLTANVRLYVLQRNRWVWDEIDIREDWMLRQMLETRLSDIIRKAVRDIRVRRMHTENLTKLFYLGCLLLTVGWINTVLWWAEGGFFGLLVLYLMSFLAAPLWDLLIFYVLKIVTRFFE